MREGSYILSTTRQLMFSLPEGCVFLPFLSRKGWNEFAAACTMMPSGAMILVVNPMCWMSIFATCATNWSVMDPSSFTPYEGWAMS